MHPEFLAHLGREHRADLYREADAARLARQAPRRLSPHVDEPRPRRVSRSFLVRALARLASA